MTDQGCRSGFCWLRLEPITGQHTNGGCNCLRELPVKLRLAVEAKIMRLERELRECKAEVNHG